MLRESLAAGLAAAPDQRCPASAARLEATLAAADPVVARDEILRSYSQVQIVSPAFHAGSAALALDPQARPAR
jgi:hypothetical protein